MSCKSISHFTFILAIGSLYTTFISSLLIFLPDNLDRHILSLVISISTILSPSLITHTIIRTGLGLGGVLQLSLTLAYHWRFYDELLKISLYGITLLSILLYIHYYLHSDNNPHNIISVGLGLVYSIFLFTLITYCSEHLHGAENYKRFTLVIVSIVSIGIVGSYRFIGKLISATTRFGISLGGLFLLLITLFLNWNYYDNYEKLMIYGIPLSIILYNGSSIPTTDMIPSKGIMSFTIGILYVLYIHTICDTFRIEESSKNFLILTISIITLAIGNYLSTNISGYGLSVGGIIMILFTVIYQFHHYTMLETMLILGILLVILLYFAYQIKV